MTAVSVRALLFTDIEGSTALVRTLRERYEGVLARHHDIIRESAARSSGTEQSREGDSLFITFPSASAALAAAVDAQRQIESERWPTDGRVRVRMGLHVGEVAETRAGLVGLAIHQAARIMSIAHGGQILLSGDVVQQAERLPPDATVRSLGVHSLRDIGEVSLHQVEHADLQREFPALRMVGAPQERQEGLGQSNLPLPVTPIVGRRLELETLGPLSLSDRLLTLTGAGGIGKSRLAVELAAHSVGCDDDGPFFVDLAPIGDVDLAPAACATALGVNVNPNVEVMALIRAALSDRAVLVVIDNCEHLLPGIAELVQALLASSPGVRVVATSRESLGIPGERVCPVEPLRVPPEVAAAESVAASDAGALFLARLPMRLSRSTLSADELAAVGAICRSVEGIPLGLELAAARSRTLSLPELADRLHRSISELAPARHGVTPRHRTMRAALDWGYQLLASPAQIALNAASVFAGGYDLSAFAAVCLDDDPATVDVLDELVRTSFVTLDFAGGQARYRLLEPVRQYASELLIDRSGLTDRRQRHLQHYLSLAQRLATEADGFAETNLDELRLELGNFRAALDWATDDTGSAGAGMALASLLRDLWTNDANHGEGLSRLVGLLCDGAGNSEVRSEAAYCAGFIASDLGDDEQAIGLWKQSLDEAVAGGHRVLEVRARNTFAFCEFGLRGDVLRARQHIERATDVAMAEGDARLQATSTLALATLLQLTGALDEAYDLVKQVLDGPAGSLRSVARAAHEAMAAILLNQGAYDAARAEAAKLLALTQTENRLSRVVGAHLDLAAIECAAGDADASVAHVAMAEQLNPIGAHGWDPAILIAKADEALVRGNGIGALAFAREAVAMEDESYRAGLQGVANLRWLGDAQLAVGDADDALVTFQLLIQRASAAHYACRVAEGHEGAAASASALGKYEDALGHLVEAREIRIRTRSMRIPRPFVDRYLATLEAESV